MTPRKVGTAVSRKPPLRTEGSRAELVATLEERGKFWSHTGNKKAGAAEAAIERLKAGDSSIRVGQTDYVVTDE